MSEWESISRQKQALETVEGLRHLSFYVLKHENRAVSVNGRSAGLPAFSEAEAKALTEELNTAVSQVIDRHAQRLLSQAANQLRRYL